MKGFSTLEIMIAFAIMAIVLSGVITADFGAQYWTITSQTSNEALYKGKIQLEKLRSASAGDFYSAQSTSLTKDTDASCAGGGLCYYIQNSVSDISSCSKYLESTISWQVPRYPTSTTLLPSYLSNATEAVSLGGDCGLNYPSGTWSDPSSEGTWTLKGAATGVDVLNGVAYVSESTSPYLEVAQADTPDTAYTFASAVNPAPFNDIDVARDLATARVYAYIAASSTQLRVIDVSDPKNPVEVASSTLAGVTQSSSEAQGWRLAYYDRKIYLATRYNGALPEFHIFDVGYSTSPFEVGSGTKLGTSVYDIIVRDQYAAGTKHRFAYLATTLDAGELMVLDVTDPKNIGTPIKCALTGNYQGTALAMLGNILFLGRDTPSGADDLYAFNATDPTSASFCTPLGETQVENGFFDYSRHVIGLRATGPYLFVETTNSTSSHNHGQLQVRSADASMTLLGSYDLSSLVDHGIDFDGALNRFYAAGTGSVQMFGSVQ